MVPYIPFCLGCKSYEILYALYVLVLNASKTQDKIAVSSKELLLCFVFSLRFGMTSVTWKWFFALFFFFCKYNFSVLLRPYCFSHSSLLGRHKEEPFQLMHSSRFQRFNVLLFSLSQPSNCKKFPHKWIRCFLATNLLNCTCQPSLCYMRYFLLSVCTRISSTVIQW